MLKIIGKNQIGDTIVEVMIAAAIVSSVLVGAYSISNLSLRQIRASQERSEAQAVASKSIEILQTSVEKYSSDNNFNSAFCIDQSNYKPLPDSNVACITGRFKTTIKVDSSNSRQFTITVTWDGINGGVEKLEYYYRIKGV